MASRGTDRGITPLLGFVILFGFLVLTLGAYQVTVVPAENMETELTHNREIQGEFQQLRAAIISSGRTSDIRTVTLPLGTDYQPRAVTINPPPATGTFETVGTEDPAIRLTISKAVGPDESADYWDGSSHSYSTGSLRYHPQYHVYQTAPVTAYDNTVIFDRFNQTTETRSPQVIVDGNRISLVILDGSIEQTGQRRVPVDIRLVSAATNSVVLGDEGESIRIELPTLLSLTTWQSLLADELSGPDSEGHITNLAMNPLSNSRFDMLVVTLEGDVDYEFRMTKVNVGDSPSSARVGYVMAVAGNNSKVEQTDEVALVGSIRDRYNNPAIGRKLTFTTDDGEFSNGASTRVGVTDGSGEVSVLFSPSTTGEAIVRAGFDTDADGFVNDESPRNRTTFSIEVTGAGPSG